MRFLFLVGACGLLGCVSFPHAQLLHGTTTLDVLTGPVVCGPVGFRKVPLQARWGEYVRVTVAAPASLRGTAVVHAGGVVQADQSWSTESTGALVVEARFPNEDPDRRFVLERERPIDITLNNLEGGCEGAVFTVEHGVLVPSIDERAWVAELERRGGPELAARREAARVEAEARRQAHYALWESRQQVEVSAQVVAQAESIRQAHYAQWEAGRDAEVTTTSGSLSLGSEVTATPGSLSPQGERVGVRASGGSALATAAVSAGGVGNPEGSTCGVAPACATGACGAIAVSGVTPTVCGSGAGAAIASPSAAPVCGSGGCGPSGAPTVCSSGACGSITVSGAAAVAVSSAAPACANGTCGSVAVSSAAPACANGTCESVAVSSVAPACATGTCGAIASPDGGATVCSSGACGAIAVSGVVPACATGTCGAVAAAHSEMNTEPQHGGLALAAVPMNPTAPITTVSAPGEWSRPSDATLRANADVVWVQPPDASLRANGAIESSWTQPFEPRLEPVAVTTESRIAVAATPPSAPCSDNCAAPVDPAPLVVPAMFQLMFNVASLPAPQPQGQVHGARPVGR